MDCKTGRMQVRPRTRPPARPPALGILVGGPVRRRRRWPWLLAALAVLAAAAAALAFAYFAWPRGTVGFTAGGLPQVHAPGFGADLERVSVRTAAGKGVAVRRGRQGVLRPVRPVVPGTRLVVEAVFRRPGWVGWVAGRTQTVRVVVTAPRARPVGRWLRVASGAPVRVRFDRPVRRVEVTGHGAPRVLHLRRPSRAVSLGRLGAAGTVGVSAVAEPWERLPPRRR